jgi:hypothetical protein
MTHGTLVTDPLDVRQLLLVFTKGPIAVDTVVAGARAVRLRQGLIDGHKAVPGMGSLGVLYAIRTVIPIGTHQALVANAVDELGVVSLYQI